MSKILRKIGKKKRTAGKKNRWEKSKNRLRPKHNIVAVVMKKMTANMNAIAMPHINECELYKIYQCNITCM